MPGDSGVTDELLFDTGAGRTGGTRDELATILTEWIVEWRREGVLSYHADPEKMSLYTRKSQAERMALVLEQVDRAFGGG